jgi:ribosome-associated translation inhibitor RaiA
LGTRFARTPTRPCRSSSKSISIAPSTPPSSSRRTRICEVRYLGASDSRPYLQAAAAGTDPYAAFDGACEKIAKQLRRYKRRLTNHNKAKPEDSILAQQFIIRPEPSDAELPEEEASPVIVAEVSQAIPTCTVSGAVMRLDLSDANAILFRNSSHGRLNMVYRRQDGNIGWVDPEATNSKG